MESHAPVAQPFFFSGQPDRPAVLMIHGFSSGPSDVIELGEYLSKHGLTVSGPCLPGHGTTPDDLNTKRASDWSAAVVSEYQRLRTVSRGGVAVVGYSFGGNLALIVTAEHALQPSGLVTINTPLFLPHEYLHRFLIPLLMRLKKSVTKSWVKPAQRAHYERLGKYLVLPLRALHAMYRVIVLSRKILRRIQTPIMVVQTRKDFNVQPRSAHYLVDQVASRDKALHWLDSPEHHYYETPQRFEVYRAIYDFINKHSAVHETNNPSR
ncbi:MAG: alpha/beta fold hydrolase [Patescibacteria group bacterium]